MAAITVSTALSLATWQSDSLPHNTSVAEPDSFSKACRREADG